MTVKRRPLFTVLLIFLLAACGGNTTQQEAVSEAQQIDLVAEDSKYDKGELQGVASQPIEVHFTNEGALAHDFTIDEIPLEPEASAGGHSEHGSEAHASEADVHLHLESGEAGTTTFTPSEAGTYTYYCTVPGHREAGMEGTLTVAEATQ
jgi:uncharacterized cupredoxin-like copper-binding protein